LAGPGSRSACYKLPTAERPPPPAEPRGPVESVLEARDHLLEDDLDRAHDLVVGRVPDLEHEDHLIMPVGARRFTWRHTLSAFPPMAIPLFHSSSLE